MNTITHKIKVKTDSSSVIMEPDIQKPERTVDAETPTKDKSESWICDCCPEKFTVFPDITGGYRFFITTNSENMDYQTILDKVAERMFEILGMWRPAQRKFKLTIITRKWNEKNNSQYHKVLLSRCDEYYHFKSISPSEE